MNTRSSKLSLAAIPDTSIGRLHVFATVIMTVHLQPPMEFAQDRALAHIGSDGSWVVAVADGMGGQPRGREAAIAAIRGLPPRIGSADEMHDGFRTADKEVAKLTPAHLQFAFSSTHMCPAATLCAAAWTPEGGLVVGYAGDTMAALLWRVDESWTGRALGFPHRYRYGGISLYVGSHGVWPDSHDGDHRRMDIFDKNDLEVQSDDYAIAVMSDGVWEPILREEYGDGEIPEGDPFGPAVAATLKHDDHDANALASRIMHASRSAEIEDNATVAVAHIGSDASSLRKNAVNPIGVGFR